jgi:hypothetical protein
MRFLVIAVAAVSFLSGVAVYALVDMARSLGGDTAHHWKVVEDYRAYMANLASYRPDPRTGLEAKTPPADPEPSLAVLVAAGELVHVDLVLPNVPNNRAANRFWLRWVASNPDIVYATGNPSYTAFVPSGTAPLHLKLWFKGKATQSVQQLIRDLEQLPAE